MINSLEAALSLELSKYSILDFLYISWTAANKRTNSMLWVGVARENSWYFATPPLVGHLPFPHLHGQPGQITVWANVTQNSYKENFLVE